MKLKTALLSATAAVFFATLANAAHHENMAVAGSDQDVSGGTVTASEINAGANGWLVVHRTDSEMKPGPVVGFAPLKKGANQDVTAILTEPVKSGEMLMLMLHGEEGGNQTGIDHIPG